MLEVWWVCIIQMHIYVTVYSAHKGLKIGMGLNIIIKLVQVMALYGSLTWNVFFIRLHFIINQNRQQSFNTLRSRQMDAISQTTFSNAFSWMKMFEFRLKFHWSLFVRFQLTILQHWFRYWLGAVQATSHYLNQWWLVYWRIYASLGLNELNEPMMTQFTDTCIDTLTIYCQTSSIKCTKYKNLNVSRLVLQLSLLNPLKSGVKSRMKM